MRDWLVGGGILVGREGLLLVQNERRNGSLDWSTPGGVIDNGETLLDGLAREVQEETGLVVQGWAQHAYSVSVSFVDRDTSLEVEAHVAAAWSGDLVVDDPDGIVVDAEFVDSTTAAGLLEAGPLWVSEPLMSWVQEGSCSEPFTYVVRSGPADEFSVERV